MERKATPAMTDNEEKILRGLKAQQSAIDRAERESFRAKPKGGAGAKIQGAVTNLDGPRQFPCEGGATCAGRSGDTPRAPHHPPVLPLLARFAAGVSQEHHLPLAEVMNTPKGPAMTPEQLDKALSEEVASHASHEAAAGGIKPSGPAADMQAALAKLRIAEARAGEEKLNLRETLKAVSDEKLDASQPLSREQEDVTLAMIRATAEQLMIDEIESRSNNGDTRGVDTRIWRGSAAAKAQGAFAMYAAAIAMERGVSAAEIEASSAFYSPVPSIHVVAERVLRDAAAREAFESTAECKTQGSVMRGSVGAKMRNAARKLYATTEAGRQAGRTKGEESGKLLEGDEPLYVLGVTEEAENETLALLQRYASNFAAEGAERQRVGLEADVAVAKYAAALALLRGLSVNEINQQAAGRNEDIDNITDEELLHRLRHQTVVLLVEERRVGTKNVEKGSAASLMQSAVDHFARSFRLAHRSGQTVTGGDNKRAPSPVKVAATAQEQSAFVEE